MRAKADVSGLDLHSTVPRRVYPEPGIIGCVAVGVPVPVAVTSLTLDDDMKFTKSFA